MDTVKLESAIDIDRFNDRLINRLIDLHLNPIVIQHQIRFTIELIAISSSRNRPMDCSPHWLMRFRCWMFLIIK